MAHSDMDTVSLPHLPKKEILTLFLLAETMKFLTEDTELKPANQCPGVKFVRVFANRSVSAAIDDQGRFYYWGSALFLPRSPTALAQYNIKSVHFLPTHIIVSTNPSAPYKLQLGTYSIANQFLFLGISI